MARTLIAYASKSGTAREAATLLANALGDADLIDLASQTPALDTYDIVVIGGGVRVGKIPKEAQRFIAAHSDELMTKNTAFFITNCFVDSTDAVFDAMLSQPLKDHALIYGSLGGRLDVDKLKGADRIIAKLVSKSVDEGRAIYQEINTDAIVSFSEAIRRAR